MGQRYVDGIGLYTYDDKLSEEEIQANIDYRIATTPKFEKQTFATGFNDTQSMIYRWWQKLTDEENEYGRWMEGQTKEWAQNVGYYDSIALEAYYAEIANARDLTGTEQSDRVTNREVMSEFREDMRNAYENNSGDVSAVQQKYGYTPEDISVLDGLMAMMQNPAASLGALTGMAVKDPELLLINFLRIPKIVAQGTEMARKTVTAATRMQPQYVKKLGKAMTNARAANMVGRGAEGAVYGGVYEALHDLTFKGEIDTKNIKTGASMGFLLGTAFGAITPTSSNSWFVDRVGSKNAEKKWNSARLNQRWQQAQERTDPNVRVNPNNTPPKPPKKPPIFRPVPTDAILPDGFTHQNRFDYWRSQALNTFPINKRITVETLDKRIENLTKQLLKKKNQDGSPLFTLEEAAGLAARHQAEIILAKKKPEVWSVIMDNALTNPQKNRKWGEFEEGLQGKNNKRQPDYEAPPRRAEEFENIYDPVDLNATQAVPKGKLAKAAAIGAVAGALVADDDKELMAFLGALSFGVARGTVLKGINPSVAKMKLVGHKIANEGKKVEEGMQKGAAMVGQLIQKLAMDDAKRLEFLTNLENFSKKYDKPLEGKYNTHKEYILAKHGQDYLEAVTAYHNTMEQFWKMGNDAGVLADYAHIQDYVTHIFGKELSPENMKKLRNSFLKLADQKSFKFRLQRELFDTIENIAKERKIIVDPVRILTAYTNSLQKVLAGKEIVKHLNKSGVQYGDEYLGLAVNKANKKQVEIAKREGYKESEMPFLKDQLLHPLIKTAIEDFYQPSIGSKGFAHKASVLNNAMKRVVLSGSLFHAQALLLSGIYAGGLVHAFTSKGRETRKLVREFLNNEYDLNAVVYDKSGNAIKVRNKVSGKFEDLKGNYVHAELVREIVDARLGIGYAKTNELTNAGYRTVKDFLDKRLPPLGKAQDKIDRITWDIIHDRSKMFAYLTMKDRLMNPKQGVLDNLFLGRKDKALDELEAREVAAQYANDAYGGQNFNKLSLDWEKLAIENANNPKGVFYNWLALAATPSRKNLSNWLLLSPDWTISNMQIGFKWAGYSTNAVKKLSKGQKLSAKEYAEMRMYNGYMVRAAISTTMLAYILHRQFAEEGSEFNINEFWKTGRLDLGNGEQMVVSKQIAEPSHWVMNPIHTFMNKGASLPKAATEILFGKQWISVKHGGSITGPTFDRTDPKDWLNWMSNKATPISLQPFKQAIVDEDTPAGYKMFGKAAGGFIGFPRYGKPDKKKIRIY